MIIHNNLSKMKKKILPSRLQGNYRGSLEEFSITSYGCLGPRGLINCGRWQLKLQSECASAKAQHHVSAVVLDNRRIKRVISY